MHENIFGNKRCKKSHNFEEWSSKSSEDGKVVEKHDSLAILHQEDQLSIEVSSSKVCFSSQEHLTSSSQERLTSSSQEHLTSSSQEHLTSDDHDHSYLTLVENFQEHIFQHGKPLEKQLTLSDVDTNLHRLLLNKKHAEKSFSPFLRNGEDIEKGIEVCVYDIRNNSYTLTFKKWTNKYYVLNGGWKDFFEDHKLEKNDTIKVWSFRHSNHSNLCFAFDYKKIES
ncbi:putative B3 domain-containing protein At4g03170 [Vigna umbellata]|uniref:putative B3 domain-containing protein At4g03170 n=1 Tax=Vigna umbellata TaxID=87088 RepID=UPI001F5ECCC6|nr:putative B3 domain-containing protein At4g03170 [Vigna umbellata]